VLGKKEIHETFTALPLLHWQRSKSAAI